MRRIIMISCLITFISITPVQAETNSKRYEMVLEDIIYSFLSPLESKAIKDYFGEIYLSDFCKFVEVKTEPYQA
ncbi:hypothetical protein ACE38V_15690 [Cytobacillus sp. Hz8]|uniref:hypothetical protein n=1 Tax=Cytobacillus sp. Hz8 TaxID=3347168 RepID=UPI0035DA597B